MTLHPAHSVSKGISLAPTVLVPNQVIPIQDLLLFLENEHPLSLLNKGLGLFWCSLSW